MQFLNERLESTQGPGHIAQNSMYIHKTMLFIPTVLYKYEIQ